MPVKREPESPISLSRSEFLRSLYAPSMSTIYGGQEEDEEESVDSNDNIQRKIRRSPAILHTSEAHKIKRELRYFFMNPVQKWRTRRRFPWKFLVQLAKIILVTIQLVLFSKDSMYHHSYRQDVRTTFSNLFLKGWKTTDEVLSYPPNGGPMAVYKQSEFYEYLDFSIVNFGQIETIGMGSYKHILQSNGVPLPATFCVKQQGCIRNCNRNTSSDLRFHDDTISKCFKISPSEASRNDWSLRNFLENQNFSIEFPYLIHARFHFNLKSFRLKIKVPDRYPDCHLLNTSVVLSNSNGCSQMTVDLEMESHTINCRGTLDLVKRRKTTKIWQAILDGLGLLACMVSLALCTRSLHNASRLKRKTNKFFKTNIGRPLTRKEKWQFVNMWYVTICVDDLLLVAGLYLKLGLETGAEKGHEYFWSACAICIGMGNFLAYVGILRYLGFYETYNVMILTLKKCAPNVLRLSVCILLIFFGYTFAGWLILGPYHFKFQTFLSSMECLYSLINGDDMFASFFSTSGKDPVIWYFSRVYLYSFISLFMWVILSIFLAVIMDAYETIKTYYEEGFPRTGLMKFVSECSANAVSRSNNDRERTVHDAINAFCCCFQGKRGNHSDYERIK